MSQFSIGIVDCGLGNLGSIRNMLERIGARVEVCGDPESLDGVGGLILPGVGAFDEGMGRLREARLLTALERKALQERVPVFGICLGLQMMTRGSQEGLLSGLGWFPTQAVRLQSHGLPIPHVGWNQVQFGGDHPLSKGLEHDARFYFVHSFYAEQGEMTSADILCSATYGNSFPAGIARGNLMGVQFHPEKSHRYGKTLLRNFVELCYANKERKVL